MTSTRVPPISGSPITPAPHLLSTPLRTTTRSSFPPFSTAPASNPPLSAKWKLPKSLSTPNAPIAPTALRNNSLRIFSGDWAGASSRTANRKCFGTGAITARSNVSLLPILPTNPRSSCSPTAKTDWPSLPPFSVLLPAKLHSLLPGSNTTPTTPTVSVSPKSRATPPSTPQSHNSTRLSNPAPSPNPPSTPSAIASSGKSAPPTPSAPSNSMSTSTRNPPIPTTVSPKPTWTPATKLSPFSSTKNPSPSTRKTPTPLINSKN